MPDAGSHSLRWLLRRRLGPKKYSVVSTQIARDFIKARTGERTDEEYCVRRVYCQIRISLEAALNIYRKITETL